MRLTPRGLSTHPPPSSFRERALLVAAQGPPEATPWPLWCESTLAALTPDALSLRAPSPRPCTLRQERAGLSLISFALHGEACTNAHVGPGGRNGGDGDAQGLGGDRVSANGSWGLWKGGVVSSHARRKDPGLCRGITGTTVTETEERGAGRSKSHGRV